LTLTRYRFDTSSERNDPTESDRANRRGYFVDGQHSHSRKMQWIQDAIGNVNVEDLPDGLIGEFGGDEGARDNRDSEMADNNSANNSEASDFEGDSQRSAHSDASQQFHDCVSQRFDVDQNHSSSLARSLSEPTGTANGATSSGNNANVNAHQNRNPLAPRSAADISRARREEFSRLARANNSDRNEGDDVEEGNDMKRRRTRNS
jgi:hypothetical protein